MTLRFEVEHPLVRRVKRKVEHGIPVEVRRQIWREPLDVLEHSLGLALCVTRWRGLGHIVAAFGCARRVPLWAGR